MIILVFEGVHEVIKYDESLISRTCLVKFPFIFLLRKKAGSSSAHLLVITFRTSVVLKQL